ncbi:MAG: hypothetical protein ACI82A_003182 [Candidatus Azotimanducaceae bacterium]|jgi:hypothetical protein
MRSAASAPIMLSKSRITLAAIAFVALTLLVLATQFERLAKMALVAYFEQHLDVAGEIRGALQLTLGTVSIVSVKDVRVVHPEATFEANIIELSVLSRSLFSQAPKITNLLIEQANLTIKSEDGLEDDEISTLDPELVIEKFEQIVQGFEQTLVHLDRAHIYQSELVYRDADQNINLNISESTVARSTNQSFELTVAGILNQANLTIEARLQRQQSTHRLYTKGRWGEYDLELDGYVEHLMPLQNVDIVLRADGPSAAPLLQLLGAKEVRDGPLSMVVHLHDQDQQLIWFSHASIGELFVHSQLSHSLFDSDFSLEFQTSGPSLREAGALIDYLEYSELPFTASGTLMREGNHLTLQESRITLGEGHFKASGLLPSFPTWDNWEFNIVAKDFDLAVLQPLSPCEIPNLAMDWTGDFSSGKTGLEIFNVSLVGSDRAISISGELGSYPDLSGSNIRISSEGLRLNMLSQCIGLPLAEDHLFETSLTLTGTANAWEIQDLELKSDLITARSGGVISHDGTLSSHVKIDIQDLNKLTMSLGADRYFNAVNVELEFDLAGQYGRFEANQGQLSTESSKGSFTGYIDTKPTLKGFDLDLTLSGTDIKKLMRDPPQIVADLPFRVTTRLSSEHDGKMAVDANISVADNQIRLQATIPRDGSLKALAINIDGQGGHLEHLLGSFVPYPLPPEPFNVRFNLLHNGDSVAVKNLLVETAGQKLTAELTLDLAPNLSQTRGQISLNGDSSRTLFNLIGLKPDFLDEPYKVQLKVVGDQDSMNIHIDDATMGTSDVTGGISVVPGDVYQLNFDLASKRIYLPTFIPTLITATDNKKDPIARQKTVLPQIEFPWRWLSAIEVDFSHEAEHVDLQPGDFASSQLAFTIENGSLLSQNISWQSDDSDGTAVLIIQQDDIDSASASVAFEIASERIPMLWHFTGTPIKSDGEHLQFNVRMNSQGKNTQELSQNLNGLVIFRDGGLRINANKLDTLFGDFLLQLTKSVFSTADKQTTVLCSGGAMTITNGKVKLDPSLAIRTSHFDVLATGEINLPNELLSLQLNSRSRQGVGISAASSLIPRVRVVGTMVKPKIQLSATETALSGGAAIASSGLSILASGLWDRLRSGLENPCDAVYDRAIKNPKIDFGVLVNGDKRSN